MNERPDVPHPPYDEFRSALGEHDEGHSALDELHAALNHEEPRTTHVEASVKRLRTIPALEARITLWLEAPRTQNWLKILSDAGL